MPRWDRDSAIAALEHGDQPSPSLWLAGNVALAEPPFRLRLHPSPRLRTARKRGYKIQQGVGEKNSTRSNPHRPVRN